METLSDDLIATKDSWLVEDETLMNSHGPITDYIDFKHGSLLAKGIGKESKVIQRRQGVSIKSIVKSGILPFKVDKLWSLSLPDKDLMVFSLLETSITVVYILD